MNEPKPPAPIPDTTLTATEHAALEYARAALLRAKDTDGSPWGSNGSVLSPEASRAMVQYLLRPAWFDVPNRLRLIMMARLGWREAADVLDRIILEYQSAHVALPSELAAWAMETKMFGRPAQWSGPKKASRMLRDLVIMDTAMAVVDKFGLPRTKRSAARKSACEVTALALESVSIFMGHKSVEKIVERYRGAWPTVPGWAA